MSNPIDMKCGMEHKTTKSGVLKIIEYINGHNVIVEFLDTGYRTKSNSQSIRLGSVKDPIRKTIHGVACFGVGEHMASIKGKTSQAYNKWNNMLIRCYDNDYQKEKPTYIGSKVCDDWLNFQNFAKWFYDNYPKDGREYCLDKDFKIIGNKIYSPATCTFVPNETNCFLTDNSANRGRYMIGVHKQSGEHTYRASCHNPFKKGDRGYIGRYKKEIDAHFAWRRKKSTYCKMIAEFESNIEIKRAVLNYKSALDNMLIYKDGYSRC